MKAGVIMDIRPAVKVLTFIMCFIILFSLSGCHSRKETAISDQEIHINEKDNSIKEQEITNEPIVLKTVYYNSGKNPENYGALTKEGYYYFVSRNGVPYDESKGETGSGNLTYLDYSSCQQIMLCSVPGCAHNNSNCTSYLSGWGGATLFTDYEEEHVLIMIGGRAETDATEEQLGKIEIMDRDGSNRKILYRLNSKEMFSAEDCIFVDRGGIYCVVDTVDAISNSYVKEVRRIDLLTGEADTILTISMGSVLCSCFDDKIMILDYQEFPMEYYVLDVTTRKTEKVFTGKGSLFVDRSFLTWVNNNNDGTGSLDIMDVRDGSNSRINGIPLQPSVSIRVDNRYGDILEWTYTTPYPEEKTVSFFVNTKTGECSEKTLCRKKYADYDIYSPVGIIGETGDGRYLVTVDAINAEVSFVDYIGIPCVITYQDHPSLALISKDDYYAGVPSYQYVDDHVYVPVS